MIAATKVEFLKNLAQYDYDNQYYDLHNDYECQKISFANGAMLLMFENIADKTLLTLKFTDVDISKAIFFNVSNIKNLTIDNIYRGRIEVKGELIEVSENGKAYFYLEFYEGQVLEFWAKGLGIEKA